MGFPGKTARLLVFGVVGPPSPKFLNALHTQMVAQLGEDRHTRLRRIAAGHRQLDALTAQRKWFDTTNRLRNGQGAALTQLRDDPLLARLRSAR